MLTPRLLIIISLMFIAVPFCPVQAQGLLKAEPLVVKTSPDPCSFLKYRFENPRFIVSVIEVEIDATGKGEVRFKEGDTAELTERRIELLPETLARINLLLDRLDFVNSTENYQHKSDLSHLGTITIQVRRADRERTVRFNYTSARNFKELSEIMRGISSQEIDLFHLEVALEHQPLDSPRQMEVLENDLKLGRISEPNMLLKVMKAIENDDSIPLITRNLAKRISSNITKKKYPSPVSRD